MERLSPHEQEVSPELPIEVPVIGFIGSSITGKDTAAAFLTERFGVVNLSISAVIRQYAQTHNLPHATREEMWAARESMEATHGEDHIPRALLKNAGKIYAGNDAKPSGFIINGIRTQSVAHAIIERGNYLLIAVHAQPETRFARKRAESLDDNLDFDSFMASNKQEDDAINSILPLADVHITNESNLESYQAQLTHEMLTRFAR